MVRAHVSRLASVIALAGGLALVGACTVGGRSGNDLTCFDACSCGPCGDDEMPDSGFDNTVHPQFGPTVRAGTPPPPVSGGTLIVLKDGHTAVAADPDRDLVYVVDVTTRQLKSTVSLRAGDEPGRLVEDGAGTVHVALRGGASLVAIDPVAGTVLSRRAACPAPRGVGWEASTDLVWVACATGELVALPATGGPPAHSFVIERDLRDVLPMGDGTLAVTKFRSAEVLGIASTNGTVTARRSVPDTDPTFASHVAWRAVPGPTQGSIVVVHQGEFVEAVQTTVQGGYGGSTSSPPSVVESVVTELDANGNENQTILPGMVLPVDLAVSPAGDIAVVSAGSAFVAGITSVTTLGASPTGSGFPEGWVLEPGKQATAVAYDAAGELLVQTRQPASLVVMGNGTSIAAATIGLSAVSRDDTGHDVFHTQAGGLIACASCHPEGGDDGFVWHLDGVTRRTPSLRGTIAGTAPYHWPGDLPDLDALVADVYTKRMDGASLERGQLDALEGWVQAIPAPPAPTWVDATSAQRGQAIFEGGTAGCSSCHAGPKLTNNQTMNVGTGGAFQVPPLVGVGWRTPLLHNGCAATIADRFGRCATKGHGSLDGLSTQDLTDLGTYLETL